MQSVFKKLEYTEHIPWHLPRLQTGSMGETCYVRRDCQYALQWLGESSKILMAHSSPLWGKYKTAPQRLMWWEAWTPADGTVERWLGSEVPELHHWVNDTVTRECDLVGGSRSPGSCCWRVCLVPAPSSSTMSCLSWGESFVPPYAPCPNVLLHQTLLEATEPKDQGLKLEQIFPPSVCSFQVLLLTMTKAWLANTLTRQTREKS